MRALWILLASPMILATVSDGETYLVTPTGGGDFPTIQAAVDHAENGDIIELTDGIFGGDGNWDVDYLSKEITIRSCSGDPSNCIVDCAEAGGWHQGFIFYDVGSGATLEGVTVRNGLAGFGGAVVCTGSSAPLISRCIFFRNNASNGGAIECDVGSSPMISQCTFAENIAWDVGGGLCL